MKIQIRDRKTGEVFSVDPTEHRAIMKTTDGEQIKVFPIVIFNMVRKGQIFDGHTIKGTRVMERIK